MNIRKFYPRRFFDNTQNKTLLIVLAVFWTLFIPYSIIMFESSALLAMWLFVSAYYLVGILYCLKNGLYRKKGQEDNKVISIPPKEFLAKVKKEVGHGKK